MIGRTLHRRDVAAMCSFFLSVGKKCPWPSLKRFLIFSDCSKTHKSKSISAAVISPLWWLRRLMPCFDIVIRHWFGGRCLHHFIPPSRPFFPFCFFVVCTRGATFALKILVHFNKMKKKKMLCTDNIRSAPRRVRDRYIVSARRARRLRQPCTVVSCSHSHSFSFFFIYTLLKVYSMEPLFIIVPPFFFCFVFLKKMLRTDNIRLAPRRVRDRNIVSTGRARRLRL